MMSINTPVAFLIFNRPDLTAIVFEAIRKAQPKKLLVVADGPRSERMGEAEKCVATRAVIETVDWDCEVLTNYSDTNLGCKQRISSGLDWVFSEVEEAIILEDDCLPTSSFFQYCQALLEYYRYDERIMHIGGNNFQYDPFNGSYTYYFSKYNPVWGWASWSRAWKHYDVSMQAWEEFNRLNLINSICESSYEREYWTDIFNRVSQGLIDTWDYQWTFACWQQNGLSIIPKTNLISNIGFRLDATHTLDESPFANLATTDVRSIEHPLFLMKHQGTDTYIFDSVFNGKAMRAMDTLPGRIRKHAGMIKRSFESLILSS